MSELMNYVECIGVGNEIFTNNKILGQVKSQELQIVKSASFNGVQCDFYQNGNNEMLMTREQIGEALEYTDPMVAICKIHDRHAERLNKFSFTNLVNGRNTYFYTSKGIYEICRWSQQPKADTFYDWVYEILEGLRTGKLALQNNAVENYMNLSEEDRAIAYFTQRKQTKLLLEQVEKEKPLVSFAETCLASKDSILIRELAKIACKQGISIGEKRLYKKLREWHLIMANSTEPYQNALDAGYFEVMQGGKETAYGNVLYKVTRVTPKGQVYIIEKLKNELMTA